jgi:hypothetical protein
LNIFLNKYKYNSTIKGSVSESELYSILQKIFHSDEIIDCRGETASCDYEVRRLNDKKPTILFENKDYSRSTTTDEVLKFQRDLKNRNHHGIMISQNSPITFKELFQIDIIDGLIHLYLPNLQYNEEKYGKWLVDENNGKNFEEFYDNISAKVGQVAKKLHGFSGGGQSLAGKDSAYLRLLFVFKTWLPETVATRFEAKRYDPILERYTEGYYRTFINKLFGEEGFRFKGLVKDLYNAAIKNENGDLTKEDAANLRKLMTEFGAIVSLFLIHMLLAAAVGDDDEKWKKLLVNQMELLNRDMTYYTDPSSIESLTQNVVPSIGTITQSIKAIKAVGGYALGQENNDGDPMYDGERTILKITKALPYLNNVNRVMYYSQRIGAVR